MSVGTELISEIERVSAVRERYREVARLVPQADCRIAIEFMTLGIEEAKRSLESDDASSAVNALVNLRGFSE